ncbi:hypothetical protein HMF8227_01835 [Saliniradius amylolyticus]|uniref:PepSY domain-containing protein n=1 Tax=Saliniradius amylolyticus TaxID=2183582 RepID=A0A2S2E3S8_9ALTE|nr:hypothetical protein [Saliniradius amylolyticus]AWL12308.1 hypothetical protein HMF8227_01835 [Saliniradius amylolyticus]
MIRLARRWHRRLMIIVGAQFLIWAMTGLYMVSMDIHFIHGEALTDKPKAQLEPAEAKYSINELLTRFDDARDVTLVHRFGQPHYQFVRTSSERRQWLVNGVTGEVAMPIDRAQAKAIARDALVRALPIESLTLHSEKGPMELSSRHLPAWQVRFDAFDAPTLYISQDTGEVVTRRHAFWRLFDWMWRFHIMDYDDGANVANGFLMVMALLGVLSALAGAVLTVYRVFRAQGQAL